MLVVSCIDADRAMRDIVCRLLKRTDVSHTGVRGLWMGDETLCSYYMIQSCLQATPLVVLVVAFQCGRPPPPIHARCIGDSVSLLVFLPSLGPYFVLRPTPHTSLAPPLTTAIKCRDFPESESGQRRTLTVPCPSLEQCSHPTTRLIQRRREDALNI